MANRYKSSERPGKIVSERGRRAEEKRAAKHAAFKSNSPREVARRKRQLDKRA